MRHIPETFFGKPRRPKGNVTLAAPFDKPYDFAATKNSRTFPDLLTPKASC